MNRTHIISVLFVECLKRNADVFIKAVRMWEKAKLDPLQSAMGWAFYEGFETARKLYEEVR